MPKERVFWLMSEEIVETEEGRTVQEAAWWLSKDSHFQILETYEYVALHGERNFQIWLRILNRKIILDYLSGP